MVQKVSPFKVLSSDVWWLTPRRGPLSDEVRGPETINDPAN